MVRAERKSCEGGGQSRESHVRGGGQSRESHVREVVRAERVM